MAVSAQSVYERFQLSPAPTRRGSGVHSGLTPTVDNTRQTVDDFLKDPGPTFSSMALPPLPGDVVDPTLTAILEGVNEIRKTVVTKETLNEFYALQRAEYQTYVQAETAPLHDGFQRLSSNFTALAKDSFEQFDRVGRLESRMDSWAASSGSEPGPDLNDVARRQVAFIGFGEATTFTERIAAMDAFMATHFADIKTVHTNLFPDKTGRPSRNGFVQFGSPKQASYIADAVKSRSLKVGGHNAVEVKRALTEIDRNRNWALRTAEGIVRKSPKAHGKAVSVKKADGRGVYVDSVPAFVQPQRHARDGIFQGEFSGLSLR